MTDTAPKIPNEVMKYGAPMGRSSWNDNGNAEYEGKFYLQNVRVDSQGYDKGGAYWGVGLAVYGYATAGDSINGYVRAESRKHAKEQVLRLYPNARFFR